jgi:aminoglycoside phosphotransferase (APT) family kinase protein
MADRCQHVRRSDFDADLIPSDAAPGWLRELHDTTSNGPQPLEGRHARNGVVAFTQANRFAAPAGVLKRAASAKRKSNLLHEARVLALLAHAGSPAQALAPRLLGLWRLSSPDTLYMLTSTLSGTPLADLPATRIPNLRSQISCLIDTLHAVQRHAGLTNEGVEVESWQQHASAELTRYARLLDDHRHAAAAAVLRRLSDVPIDQSSGHRLVHRDLSPTNLIIQPGHEDVTVRACDFASSFFGPRLWELAGAELFLFPARPELRAPLRSHFEHVAGDRCAEQTLCLTVWQLARLYAAAHRRGDAAATRRIAHALNGADPGPLRDSSDCYRHVAMLGDHLRSR